ncbi:unnamed protein product [Candidula unifasciata]|uniref:C2H2-type domain-containing protein n=1 Tax=Candidula unifasciata TaxID=100452 RepID=A0A8S3ZGS1_9EUPU|nr:unnamed protein product [Candidula unifasciata]
MTDFVAEVRPRSDCIPKFVPTHPGNDFVAEIRPRNTNIPQLRYADRLCQSLDYTDQDLENILSNRHFSREGFTRLLEGSILKLIETLFTGRPITQVEGRLCISLASHESPITVNLQHTFQTPNQANDHSFPTQCLESRMNVKVKQGDLSCPGNDFLTIPENEPINTEVPLLPPSSLNDKSFAGDSAFDDCRMYPLYLISDSNDRSYFPLESTRDGERCSPSPSVDPPCKASFMKEIEVTTVTESSQLETRLEGCLRHESDDDESGYTSNEKEDCDSNSEHSDSPSDYKHCSLFNDYYCSGFDGKSTVYSSDERETLVGSPRESSHDSPGDGGDEMDNDDDDADECMDFEMPLVIDERPVCNMKDSCSDQMCKIKGSICKERAESYETDHGQCSPRVLCGRMKQKMGFCHERMGDYLTDETEDFDSVESSDITDTDVPVDLSSDWRRALDATTAIRHPQSLVGKQSEAFRNKRFSQSMTDTEALSGPAQADRGVYGCTVCSRTFTAKNNLKRHIRIHTGQRPYQCLQCSQSFARRDDLKGHMLRHDYNKPFRCSLCKKGYTDRACVKNHMAKEHRSRLMHVCPQCGESYDQEEAFTAHKKTHPELQQFSCSTCSFIGNNNLMTLKHSLLHSHKLFSCKPCNAYFADPFDYTNHVRKHKKSDSFSQYVCCFCDIALSTYEQYVRHEYSHAQGKIHACKICKKQFKNKFLLQEHALTHEMPQAASAHSEQIPTKTVEIEKPNSIFLQPKEIIAPNISNSSLESRFTDDYSSTYYDPPPLPSHLPRTDKEESNKNEALLLDLRIKKASNATFSANDLKQNQYASNSCPRKTGLTERNFPRNGVVSSESSYLGQEMEVSEAYQMRKLVCKERSRENIFPQGNNISREKTDYIKHHSQDRHVPESPFDGANSHQIDYWQQRNICPTRPKSAEKIHLISNAQSASFDRRPFQRTVSQDCTHKSPLRFSPYTREKVADLAAKFIAARGTKLFEDRAPLKAALATYENRKLIAASRDITEAKREASTSTDLRHRSEPKEECVFKQNLFSNSPSAIRNCLTTPDTDDITREDSNPEMALMYHAPIVVKSEVVMQQDPEFEAAEHGTFPNTFVGNGDAHTIGSCLIERNHYQMTTHSCEDCKQEFRSFTELEHHSVEMHKRYLCEHCRKSFTARPNRDRHVRYHTGERPYRCDLCEQAFFRGDDLKYHRTTRHPTAQPYTCGQCSASFSWGRDLDRHIRHSKCKS